MSKPPKAWSQKNARKPADSQLSFDVHWLSGQKSSPPALPTRQEFLNQKNAPPPTGKRSPRTVNILASFLALGTLGAVGYGLYRSDWLAPKHGSDAIAKDTPTLTPQQQRQADETIEAILALQEMAANADSNPTTQKR